MTNPSQTTPASGSAQSIKERLARLEQDLIRQRRRVDATTTLTAIVGILILVAVGGYMWYGYNRISIVKDPNTIVDFAAQTVDENLPQLRRNLEGEIVSSAPEWASGLSKQALGSLPAGRQQFEKLVMENLDGALAETREKTNEQFRSYISNNKEHLKKQFEELAKSPDLADTTFADMQADLEKDLGLDFQANAAALLKELTAANQSFKKLRDGKNLNEQQQLERRCWMLARAIVNHETLDLSTTGLPEVSKASSTKPVSIKTPAESGKPTKRSPVPATAEDDKKDNKSKEAGKNSEKKDDAAKNGDKKKETASDGAKKKDASEAKPDGKN
jgi:CHASE3 domain sensor protein